jgi:hypothetical protein
MIRRITLTFAVTLLAAAWLGAGATAPARAASPSRQMHEALMAMRGLIDRAAEFHFFVYPSEREVAEGRLGGSWWPADPWTGARMTPGRGRGHYRYTRARDRRSYRLIGYVDGGRITLEGHMPKRIKLAYDHRGEEGLNLIRQYVEDYAAAHDGVYPLPAEVAAEGPVGTEPQRHYWPSNPWDHGFMSQRRDRGSFAYEVAPDRASYTLRLNRALKHDYVLTGSKVASPWQQLLASLEDEILRRSGRILAGYVTQWSLQHASVLPKVTELAPTSAVGLAHADWPLDPVSGTSMQPGTVPGTYEYAPGAAGTYTLTIHLHSGDFKAGGSAPPAPAPARDSVPPES